MRYRNGTRQKKRGATSKKRGATSTFEVTASRATGHRSTGQGAQRGGEQPAAGRVTEPQRHKPHHGGGGWCAIAGTAGLVLTAQTAVWMGTHPLIDIHAVELLPVYQIYRCMVCVHTAPTCGRINQCVPLALRHLRPTRHSRMPVFQRVQKHIAYPSSDYFLPIPAPAIRSSIIPLALPPSPPSHSNIKRTVERVQTNVSRKMRVSVWMTSLTV